MIKDVFAAVDKQVELHLIEESNQIGDLNLSVHQR